MNKRITNEIFFDMDGVLYDLSDIVNTYVNEDFHTNYPKGFNQSYDWKDYKDNNGNQIPTPYFDLLLQKQGIFYDGNPVDDAIKTVNKLYLEKYDIHILTKPQVNLYCFYEKAKWIQKFFPWLDLNTHFHASGSKGLFANPNRILVDDDIRHLTNWKDSNGTSICFSCGWNRDWNGHKANNMREVYQLIKVLSEI